jgi:hypothetical protein
MDKFNVLPTDERYLNLYEEQKVGLFYGINELPFLDNIKTVILKEKNTKDIETKNLEDFIPKERVTKLKEIYKKQGMTKEQIDAELERTAKAIKEAELFKIKKEK